MPKENNSNWFLHKKYLDEATSCAFMSEKANLSTKFEVLSVKLNIAKRLKDDYGKNDRRMINLNGFIFAFKPNGSMVSDLQLKCW